MSKMGQRFFEMHKKCGFTENEFGEAVVNWKLNNGWLKEIPNYGPPEKYENDRQDKPSSLVYKQSN